MTSTNSENKYFMSIWSSVNKHFTGNNPGTSHPGFLLCPGSYCVIFVSFRVFLSLTRRVPQKNCCGPATVEIRTPKFPLRSSIRRFWPGHIMIEMSLRTSDSESDHSMLIITWPAKIAETSLVECESPSGLLRGKFFAWLFVGHFAGLSPARFSPAKSPALHWRALNRSKDGFWSYFLSFLVDQFGLRTLGL